jgi:hypothetical protein
VAAAAVAAAEQFLFEIALKRLLHLKHAAF